MEVLLLTISNKNTLKFIKKYRRYSANYCIQMLKLQITMASSNNLNTYTPDSISIPGATIKDLMDELGITQKELAEKMKVSSKTLNEIIKGESPITQEIAAVLEKVLKVPASFWLSREKQYREFLALQKKPVKLKEEVTLIVHNIPEIKKTTSSISPARHRL